jgi:hypothetical protein
MLINYVILILTNTWHVDKPVYNHVDKRVEN